MAGEDAQLAAIQRQLMWNRLIAVVEEQAQTMIRTAFSTTVREAGDLSAGISGKPCVVPGAKSPSSHRRWQSNLVSTIVTAIIAGRPVRRRCCVIT